MLKAYYQLAKPGIIYGNTLTATAGFFLAVRSLGNLGGSDIYVNGNVTWPHLVTTLISALIATLIGLSLIIGGACVFNNYYDRDIDAKMERTKGRELVTGAVSQSAALIYGTILLVLGAVVLGISANTLTMLIALLGAFVYVLVYTPLKRRTYHSALIGAIAGATPPVVGLCAVTNSLAGRAGLEGLMLFLVLILWQMPHFYAIAMYRSDDYRAADIPTLPAVRGVHITKIAILLYVFAFMIVAASLTPLDFTSLGYLIVVLMLGAIWLTIGVRGFLANANTGMHAKNIGKINETENVVSSTTTNDIAWARRMFIFSLIVITVLSGVLIV
jgi:protoheme IX farnesyltransferase